MKERVFLSNNQDGIMENYWMMQFLNVTDVLTNRVNCSGSTFNLTLFWRVVRDLRALLVIASAPWVLEWATKKSLDGSNSACTLTMTPFVYNVMCMFIDMYYGFKMRGNITALPPGDFLFAYQITRRPGSACTKRLNLRGALSLTFS